MRFAPPSPAARSVWGTMAETRSCAFAIVLQLWLAAYVSGSLSGAVAEGRISFADSIVGVPNAALGSSPRRVRERLTADESAESVDFIVSLKMRDLDRLEALVQSGRTLSAPEMEKRHLPLTSDYDRVEAWLTAQGFAITLDDSNHTNIAARGSVARIAEAFGVAFARVATD